MRAGTIATGIYLAWLIRAAMSMNSTPTRHRIIDSHLHVWANPLEAAQSFPYASGQDPIDSLQDRASIASLIEMMDQSGVDGALIVQPINYQFDHAYVIHAIQSHPDRFKGMLLHNPRHSPEQAVEVLEDLASKGFVGVRFNPYLWPKQSDGCTTPMSSSAAALAVYKRCAEKHMAVGVMCFQGLQLHYDDILKLIQSSPETNLILDHFGFCSFTDEGNAAFQQLLALAEYHKVTVKISAPFRLKDEFPYRRVQNERLTPLLAAFGTERLLFGSDFPFVLLESEGYGGAVELIQSWILNDHDRAAVMGVNAERLFGSWGSRTTAQQK
jgi:predicted TIM-barrel fold metal-dependent hydrolase